MLNDQPRKKLLQRVSTLGIKVDQMISQLTFKPDPIVLYVLMELTSFTFKHGPMNGAFIFQSFFPIYSHLLFWCQVSHICFLGIQPQIATNLGV